MIYAYQFLVKLFGEGKTLNKDTNKGKELKAILTEAYFESCSSF